MKSIKYIYVSLKIGMLKGRYGGIYCSIFSIFFKGKYDFIIDNK